MCWIVAVCVSDGTTPPPHQWITDLQSKKWSTPLGPHPEGKSQLCMFWLCYDIRFKYISIFISFLTHYFVLLIWFYLVKPFRCRREKWMKDRGKGEKRILYINILKIQSNGNTKKNPKKDERKTPPCSSTGYAWRVDWAGTQIKWSQSGSLLFPQMENIFLTGFVAYV